VGPVPAPKPCQDGSILARWIAVLTVIRKLAVLVYASSAKRTASTRPGPLRRPAMAVFKPDLLGSQYRSRGVAGIKAALHAALRGQEP